MKEDPLQQGLRTHTAFISVLAQLLPYEPTVVQIGRWVDELIAAVSVDTLQRADTEEDRQKMIKEIRGAYEQRWGEKCWMKVGAVVADYKMNAPIQLRKD